MLELITVVLLGLWLLGYFGPRLSSRVPRTGNFIHVLLIAIAFAVAVRLLA